MFIENNVLKEEELLSFIIFLEGTSSLEWEAEEEREYNLVQYAPVINELWDALNTLDNKNLIFGRALQIKLEEITQNLREDFAATDSVIMQSFWSTEQIDDLFPGSSHDFKNLAFYIGNKKALNNYVHQEEENYSNNEEKKISDTITFLEQFLQEAEQRASRQANNSSLVQNSLLQRNTGNESDGENQFEEYDASSGNSPK